MNKSSEAIQMEKKNDITQWHRPNKAKDLSVKSILYSYVKQRLVSAKHYMFH